MLDYDNSYKTCDICGKEFKAKYRRYHCDHCDKYFYVCNTCVKKDKIPCRFCGVGLKKKRERLKKAN
jgi:hypothetical protein